MAQLINAVFPTGSVQNYVIASFTGDKGDQTGVRQKLGALTADVCKSFIAGQITSPLKAISGSSAVRTTKELLTSANQVMTTVGQLTDPNEITRIVTTIVNNTVQSVLSYVTKDVTDGINTIIDFPEFSYLTNEAFKRFQANIKAYIPQILDPTALQNSKKVNIDLGNALGFATKKMSKFMGSVSYQATRFNNFITKYGGIASYWATTACEYAAMGPDWIDSQLQLLLKPVLDKVHGWIQAAVDAIEGLKTRIINGIIDWVVDKLTNIFINLMLKCQQKINSEFESQKTKIEAELKRVENKAAAKLEALTGIQNLKIDPQAAIDAAQSIKRKMDLIKLLTNLMSSSGLSNFEQNMPIVMTMGSTDLGEEEMTTNSEESETTVSTPGSGPGSGPGTAGGTSGSSKTG